MKKNIYITLCVCMLVFSVKAQRTDFKPLAKEEAVKMLQKANHWFHTVPSYSFAVTHAMYAGYTAAVPYDQKKGYYKKLKDGFHSYLVDVHSIQNKKYLILIDSNKKTMLVSDPREVDGTELSFEEYTKSLEHATSFKMARNGDERTVRIEFIKGFPVSAYEFVFNKEGLYGCITVFYAREVKSNTPQGMVKPKLKIVFEKYAEGVNAAKNELSESVFFTEANNKLYLKELYKGYTLLDQRIKSDKKP